VGSVPRGYKRSQSEDAKGTEALYIYIYIYINMINM
jgi:hypothetical protein